MITETIEQTIIDYSSNIVQEVIIQEETISELGQIGHGVASGGTTGQVLAKKTDTNYDTEWVTNSGGGGGGSTNLTYTASPIDGTVVSSSGTDATLPLVDVTNAGLVSPSMKTTWDGKQDALGFTPYNATNPSGYQTLAQVNAKISDDAWEVGAEGLTNIASSQNAVFNGIANVFVYAEYLDDNKQPIADVLSNTTASFTTANETKLDGIATGATANDTDANLKARANHTGTQTASTISDLNSVSRAQTEAELLAGANITITPSGTGASRQLTIASTGGSSAIGAFKMLANNTNASAVPTEQVYKDVAEQSLSGTGMIATGGALPTGTNTHFFRWSQKGNLVTVRINLQFQTAGTCSGIAIPFANMADIPQIPQHANIYAGAGDVIIYGAGNLNNTKTFPLFTTAMGLSGIRIKTIGTPNTYEFVVGRTSSSYNNGWIHIQYYI